MGWNGKENISAVENINAVVVRQWRATRTDEAKYVHPTHQSRFSQLSGSHSSMLPSVSGDETNIEMRCLQGEEAIFVIDGTRLPLWKKSCLKIINPTHSVKHIYHWVRIEHLSPIASPLQPVGWWKSGPKTFSSNCMAGIFALYRTFRFGIGFWPTRRWDVPRVGWLLMSWISPGFSTGPRRTANPRSVDLQDIWLCRVHWDRQVMLRSNF